MELDLIYTEKDLIISNKHHDWRTWQDWFKEYKASLSFQSVAELVDFLQSEYNLSQMDCKMISNELSKTDSDFWLLDLPTESLNLTSLKKYSTPAV